MRPRVGLLEGRMTGELAALVVRHGGEPRLAPALLEAPLDARVAVGELIDALGSREVEIVLFLTGVGANALFGEAERIGRLDELVERLQRTVNVCRGQKPWQPLKRRGVPITVTVPDPYTTADVVGTMARLDLEGRGVALLHYGERSAALAEELDRRGARVHEVSLYEWRLPEDLRPLEALIGEIARGEVDALAFTSQVQVRHLFEVAGRLGLAGEMAEGMGRLVVAAVGPTCAAALEAAGVRVDVVPANPKMGPMVVALMERLRGGAGERA